MRLIPRHWDRFQHYRHRRPPWIKVHRCLLSDPAFMSLALASRALAVCLWLLASESSDGTFDADADQLSFDLRITEAELLSAFTPLLESGLFLDASTMLAPASNPLCTSVPLDSVPLDSGRTSSASLNGSSDLVEQQTQGTPVRTHRPSVDLEPFERFWEAFDKKIERKKAVDVWKKIRPDDALTEMILRAATAYREATPDKSFRKGAFRWLRDEGWTDEIVKRGGKCHDGPAHPAETFNDTDYGTTGAI